MIGLAVLLALVATQSTPADTLRLLAGRLTESALVLEVRSRPLAIRDALTDALRQSVRGRTALRDAQLAIAGRLAAAHAAAWADSFFVGEVRRFMAWPPLHRARKVWADSVRRAGVTAYARDGPAAAIVIWRRALGRATSIGDSAGIAAVQGNIGAALLEEGQLDSAAAYLERARALAARLGDLRVEGNALGMLAEVRAGHDDVAGARELYARALTLRTRIGDTRGTAADHNNLGLLAQTLGDVSEARRHFEAALDLNRRDGRPDVAATNLVNLAGLASLAGDFTRAAALYRDALATWRAEQRWADVAVALHGLAQLELRRGDYPAAVLAFREALEIYQRTGPLADALQVQQELAAALAAEGELQHALEMLGAAQRVADSAGMPSDVRGGLAAARAALAWQLNMPADAERLYVAAERLYRRSGDRAGAASAQEGRGLLLLARGEHARAQVLLEAALRAHGSLGDRRAAALARLALAQVRLERGDTTGARAQMASAEGELLAVGDPVAAAAARADRAALEAEAGFPAAAESLYIGGLEWLGGRLAPDVAWRLHAGLALTRRARHDLDGAVRELRAAVAEIERAGGSLSLPERRAAFLLDKWDVYAQLALTEQRRGRPHAAFEAAELLRAREMRELLARGRLAPADTAADLVAREQDLRRRIAELSRQHARDASTLRGGNAAAGPVVAEALSQAQVRYAELLLEMRERLPDHAGVVAPRAAGLRDVAQRLASGDAFIEYLVSDSGAIAFLITRDSTAALDLPIGRRKLARLVEFARGTLIRPGSQLTDSLWRGPLRELHARLIAPLESAGLLARTTRLVLAPHAELHYLPFAALLDGAGRFLIERYELTTTPSASVWLALGDRRARRAAGVGVLALAPRPGALPASRREVSTIERLAEARVLRGAAATEAALRREAPHQRVVHLATFGVLNKNNPLFSYVELSPDEGHDGRLAVHEVYSLDLAADLVVLSACQTGLGSGTHGDVPAGDDWVGLTRAFLHAGAAQVIATLWPVDDWATAELIETFYQTYGGGSTSPAALARAQRTLLGGRATRHPFYWAGFAMVVGAGAGAGAPQ